MLLTWWDVLTNYISAWNPSNAEMIKQKALKLACKQARYGSRKMFLIFLMELKICTDKLSTAATVHFLREKWLVHTYLLSIWVQFLSQERYLNTNLLLVLYQRTFILSSLACTLVFLLSIYLLALTIGVKIWHTTNIPWKVLM